MSIPTALIGLGRIGWALEKDRLRYHPCTHAGVIHQMSRARARPILELQGVCDTNPAKLKAFRKWWGSAIDVMHESAAETLAGARADLVVIATPPASHRDLALAAMVSRPKAIILEKPVALSLSDARDVQAMGAERNVSVWINFERRYHPGYAMVREYVKAKRLGPVRRVTGTVLTGGQGAVDQHNIEGKAAGIGGALLHDAVHWIDLLIWMFGKPAKVEARPAGGDTTGGRTALVDFIYPDFTASLESGGERRYFEFNMVIDFERGRIRAGNDGHYFFQSAVSKRYQGFSELAPFRCAIPDKNPWVEMYREITDSLRGKKQGRARTGNLADAVLGMEIIDQLVG